jgi:uncharacterized membrane protein YhaH (DUF805 family)
MTGAYNTLLRWNDWQGRSTRTEYWMFVLWCTLGFFALFCLFTIGAGLSGGRLGDIVGIVLAVPIALLWLWITIAHLAVSVRRLHDIGFSGWWLLLIVLPMLSLVLLIFYCLDSQPGENRFGPNPKLES